MAKLSIYISDEDLESIGRLSDEYEISRNRIIGFSVRYMLWKYGTGELELSDYNEQIPRLKIPGEKTPDEKEIRRQVA